MDMRLKNIWKTDNPADLDDPTAPQNLPFGGFDIYIFGDFRQLPPVGSRGMYMQVDDLSKVKAWHKTTHAMCRGGHKAYRTIDDVFTLPESIRQKDPKFTAHLDRMGEGLCNSSQFDRKCIKTGQTDRQYWAPLLINETDEDGMKWLGDDDTVILVHENTEALRISAEYAIGESAKRNTTLWQLEALNTTYPILVVWKSVSHR